MVHVVPGFSSLLRWLGHGIFEPSTVYIQIYDLESRRHYHFQPATLNGSENCFLFGSGHTSRLSFYTLDWLMLAPKHRSQREERDDHKKVMLCFLRCFFLELHRLWTKLLGSPANLGFAFLCHGTKLMLSFEVGFVSERNFPNGAGIECVPGF